MRLNYFCLLLFFLAALSLSAQTAIRIDEDFSDWENIPDQGSGDFEFKIADDRDFLFIYFSWPAFAPLQRGNQLTLYLDTDNNPNTGTSINGIGAELQYTFGSREGSIRLNGASFNVGGGDFFLTTAPTVWSDQFEVSIPKDISFGGTPLFSGNAIRAMLRDGDAFVNIPGAAGGAFFQLTETPGASTPYQITPPAGTDLRILSHNVLFDNLFNNSVRAAFDRLYLATVPDIFAFQEIYDHNINAVANRIEAVFPSSPGESWKAASINDNFIVSRFAIKDFAPAGPFGNGAFLLDLRPRFDSDLLVIVAHPPCCDRDFDRQNEFDGMMGFLRDAMNGAGPLTLAPNTPVVITGDMNLVGDARQVATMLTGDIVDESAFGPDFNPDWDGTALEDALPFVAGSPLTFTQKDRDGGFRSFSAGRLDYMVYSGSALDLLNTYVLYTPLLPADSLQVYGLQNTDSQVTSDHFPLVADFSLSPMATSANDLINDETWQLRLAANPVSGQLQWTWEQPTAARIAFDLFDTEGRRVRSLFQGKMPGGKASLTADCTGLPAGTYFLTWTTAGRVIRSERVVIVR